MKFAIYSVEATSLSWWKRLQDEGNEVLVYIQNPMQKEVGRNLIPLAESYFQWQAWGRGGVYFFDCTDAGDKADSLRRAGELS